MNLRALRDNVYSRQILFYLLGPIVAAVVLLPIRDWQEEKIAVFALFVFSWSMFFPARFNAKMDKEAVDFWYYTLSIIGVVLLFLAGGLEREKIRLRDEYQSENAKLQAAQFRKDLLQAVADESDTLLRTMKEFAQGRERISSGSLKACEEALLFERLKRMERTFEVDPGIYDIGRPPEIFDPTSICLVAMKEGQWREIAAAETVAGMLAMAEKYELAQEFRIELGGRRGTVAEFGKYLVVVPHSDDWKTRIQTADDDIGKARTAANAASTAFARLGDQIDSRFSRGLVDVVSNYIWPYLLITALGMKLARVPYLKAPTPTRAKGG